MSSDAFQHFVHHLIEWERNRGALVPKPITEDEHLQQASLEDRIAGLITDFAGSMRFVYIHLAWFVVWIVVNAGLLIAAGLGLGPFDPFPFGLLTLVVSLEAIFLSTFVMIAQNRQADIADRRAQADYDVNVRAEAEIARLTKMVAMLLEKELTPPPPQ
ncbi:MAG TPA: DUF1003 domain-containing protein [Chloroflexota bacterium]